jgi:hypothetical protein
MTPTQILVDHFWKQNMFPELTFVQRPWCVDADGDHTNGILNALSFHLPDVSGHDESILAYNTNRDLLYGSRWSHNDTRCVSPNDTGIRASFDLRAARGHDFRKHCTPFSTMLLLPCILTEILHLEQFSRQPRILIIQLDEKFVVNEGIPES